jgi:hypothetical protein
MRPKGSTLLGPGGGAAARIAGAEQRHRRYLHQLDPARHIGLQTLT